MKNTEILTAAIKKAYPDATDITALDDYGDEFISFVVDDLELFWNSNDSFIFSHEFAKAFWGEEDSPDAEDSGVPEWQYHLQQMVLEVHRISYLVPFLPKP